MIVWFLVKIPRSHKLKSVCTSNHTSRSKQTSARGQVSKFQLCVIHTVTHMIKMFSHHSYLLRNLWIIYRFGLRTYYFVLIGKTNLQISCLHIKKHLDYTMDCNKAGKPNCLKSTFLLYKVIQDQHIIYGQYLNNIYSVMDICIYIFTPKFQKVKPQVW